MHELLYCFVKFLPFLDRLLEFRAPAIRDAVVLSGRAIVGLGEIGIDEPILLETVEERVNGAFGHLDVFGNLCHQLVTVEVFPAEHGEHDDLHHSLLELDVHDRSFL